MLQNIVAVLLLVTGTAVSQPVACGRGTVQDENGVCVVERASLKAEPDGSLVMSVAGAKLTLESTGCGTGGGGTGSAATSKQLAALADELLLLKNRVGAVEGKATVTPQQVVDQLAAKDTLTKKEIADVIEAEATEIAGRIEADAKTKGNFSVVFSYSDRNNADTLPQAVLAAAELHQANFMPREASGQYALIGAAIEGGDNSVNNAIGTKVAYVVYRFFVQEGDGLAWNFGVCNHADSATREHSVEISFDNGVNWKETGKGNFGSTGLHTLQSEFYALPQQDHAFTGTVLIKSAITNPESHNSGTHSTYVGWKNLDVHCIRCQNFNLIPSRFSQMNVDSNNGHTIQKVGGWTTHEFDYPTPNTPGTRALYRNDVHGMGLIKLKASAGGHCRCTEMGWMKANSYERISQDCYGGCGSISFSYSNSRLYVTFDTSLDHMSIGCIGDCIPWTYNH